MSEGGMKRGEGWHEPNVVLPGPPVMDDSSVPIGHDEQKRTFPSLQELRESVHKLERELKIDRADSPLSGRIIHVAHKMPFLFQSMAEIEYQEKKEAQSKATNTVALLAEAARKRRAERAEREAAEAEREEQRALQRQNMQQQASSQSRRSSFWNSRSRRASGVTSAFSGMRSQFLDNIDLDKQLMENLERSRRRAGRRAWMMTEVVDDTSEASEDDRFSPVSTRRNSRYTNTSTSSMDELPSWMPKKSGISDLATPSTPPEEEKPTRPPWYLSLTSVNAAMNSGVNSLTATHHQTYIACPENVVFAAKARNDDRTDVSQITSDEKVEIEQLLASLEDRAAWTHHEGGLVRGPSSVVDQGQTALYGIRYVPVWLDYRTMHAHYEGYCKSTLWPLFHYLLWRDDADRTKWDQYSWEAYVKVNEAFAQRVVEQYQPGDIVWVHDYHLLLVPHLIRKQIPDAHIGLFVHSSFPSSEFFRCLPQRHDLIDGMLGADLCCFQNRSYASHFISSCVRINGFEVQGASVESYNGRVTHVSYNPMGIDVDRVRRDSNVPGVAPKMAQLRDLYADKRILIGCDKLDVVRGVIQKLQAFYALLLNYPEWREKVVLIQITIPAMNSSAKLEREVSELVSLINGDFGSLSFTPVQHYHQVIDRDEFYALLSVADVALVTSVRDGMHTMSMEYVVCQHEHGKGSLILSEFTGTAARLPSAIHINPWDIQGVADAIDRGLRLPAAEREERHRNCFGQVIAQTSHTWALSLVQQMLLRLRHRYSAHSTRALDCDGMLTKFRQAKKRLLLLDYDGTLTPIVKDPESAVPSQRLLDAMETLLKDDRNGIYLISGRDEKFLRKHFDQFPALGLSAEHGSYFKEHGASGKWVNLSAELDMSWKSDVLNVFRYYTDRTIGSMIEEKKSSIVWHYRNADPEFGSFQAKDCRALLDNILAENQMEVEVVVGKKNVEVRPLAINKGEIVHRILYANPDTEFVFCVGDDKTDEDMFRFLSGLSSDVDEDDTEEHAPTLDTIMLQPPTPLNRTSAARQQGQRKIDLRRDEIFTSTVGPDSKRTLADWHVGDVQNVIDALVAMAQCESHDS
ncbi:hypothetical protein MYAM1_001557 [Malassezia yamatoensis]|uniref:Trehalose-phosphatase n=1 Tax=Malassezia yamatoensis TaxID=253288 RepID=A0AAJ5YQZ8_9BASI|nr:hypothetical protein MYAM1_001557 [Malassezia yamatoensis]